MECPDSNEIAALVDGRLDDASIGRLQDHLDTCPTCFALVAELARGDQAATTGGAEVGGGGWRERRQLEEYRLIRPIGRGSGGQVWLAHDSLLDREVAIKFLSSAASVRARDRFRIEVRAIARLSHPNVVTVYRVGEVDGQPYLVSELIRGESLDTVARPMPWERVREIGIGLARGLAAAHRAGIIHRDIKPGNAVVGEDGQVKLLDFGLAKLHDTSPEDPLDDGAVVAAVPVSMTATGQLLGTPLYMAPEAWSGEAPTCAMDVYSLGALLYELATGEPPHVGPTLGELRRSALEDTPRSLRSRVPGIAPAFAAVIDRCLATTAAARYPSGQELCVALETTLAPARRRRRLVAPLAIVSVLALGGLAAVAMRRSDEPAATRTAAALLAAPQRCSSDRWCWDVSWIGSLADVWGATPDDLWVVGERGVVRHLLDGVWSDASVGTVADLVHIGGTARDDVWVVGGWGTILHWNGKAWQELASNTHNTLTGLWASSRDNAWAVGEGGLILHWDGKAWRAVAAPTTANLVTVAGSGPDDVWVTGYATCLHWDGQAWTPSDIHANEILSFIDVVGPRDVWVTGFHSVIRHWNGTAWATIAVPEVASPDPVVREDFPFNGGAGASTGELWVIAKRRGFLHRVDGVWTRVDQGTTRELFSVHAFGPNDAWAVGSAGALVHWDGRIWRTVGAETPYRGAASLWARTPTEIWAVGIQYDERGRIRPLASRFDGRAWTEVFVPADHVLHAVTGDRDDVWAVGDRGTIVGWHDGAPHVDVSGTTQHLRGVWIDAPGRAWAVGDGGVMLRYRDGAWHSVPGGSAPLYGIWGAGPGDAWAVGEAGILRLVGEAWTPVAGGTDQPLAAVWGSRSDDVWAVGERGTTVHWDGRAWTSFFSDFDQPLAAISGSRGDDVWAVSNSDQGGPSIIHWNGSFWTRIERTTHTALDAVVAAGPDEAWASGAWGSFLHHIPGT